MAKYEKINVGLPVNGEWGLKEIDEKAEKLGLNRNELAVKAIDMYINFSGEFLKEVEVYKEYLKAFNVPEYMIIENIWLSHYAKKQGQEEAYTEAGLDYPRTMIKEFPQVEDSKGLRILTGSELIKLLKEQAKREELQEIDRSMKRREA